MRYGDNVPAGIGLDQPMDGARHPLDDRQETLAAWRGLMGRRVPEPVEIAGPGFLQFLIAEALPVAEILFGEFGQRDCPGTRDRPRSGEPRANYGRRRLVGAPPIARHPHPAPP